MPANILNLPQYRVLRDEQSDLADDFEVVKVRINVEAVE